MNRVARGQACGAALLGLIVMYGGALRLDAIIGKYGPIEGPGWIERSQAQFQEAIGHVRPAALRWTPNTNPYVGGDPINYIRFAREMQGFYQAHVREPVFLATTKAFLWLTEQQDVSVSLASGFFSTLAVVATYLLGAYAFGSTVGLGAAAALAIERTVISWGADGWKDDAFTFVFALSLYAALRLHRRPSVPNTIFAGIVWAVACLTRITAVSFILPVAAYAAVSKLRQPRVKWVTVRHVGASLLITTVFVAPYLINCWIEFGDPLYAINAHTEFYRAREGLEAGTPMTWADYLGERASTRPVGFAERSLVGLTTYSFDNKWTGFDVWAPWLGPGLRWLALVGLLLLAWRPSGRLLLVGLLTALVPYAFTWHIRGGAEWRFTAHAYPVFLIAATFSLARVVSLVQSAAAPHPLRRLVKDRRRLAIRVAVTVLAGSTVWASLQLLPYWRMRENLRAGDPIAVMAGERDRVFFRRGWYRPTRNGNVVARFSRGETAAVHVPMLTATDHRLVVRLDPFEGAPQQRVVLRLNGYTIGSIVPAFSPARIGTYSFEIPGSVVAPGMNRLELTATHATDLASLDAGQIARWAGWDLPRDGRIAIMLWYVRVEPL